MVDNLLKIVQYIQLYTEIMVQFIQKITYLRNIIAKTIGKI